MQLKQSRVEAWKSQDFNEVWARDLVIPVRRSNQLSYEATDMAARATNFIFECCKCLSRVSEANEWEILSAQEDKIRIPKRPCNLMFIL